MIFYTDTIWEGTPEHCQEFNLERPTLVLMEAMKNDESFVMLSRPEVFDMSVKSVYIEHSRRNASCVAGKILSIMEDKVLEYNKGFVIRAAHIVSDIMDEMRAVATNMAADVSPCQLRPISMSVVDHIANVMTKSEWDCRRILHVPEMAIMSLAEIAYRLSDGEFDFNIDQDGVSISQDYQAVMTSVVSNAVLGGVEVVNCMAANEFMVVHELFGGTND